VVVRGRWRPAHGEPPLEPSPRQIRGLGSTTGNAAGRDAVSVAPSPTAWAPVASATDFGACPLVLTLWLAPVTRLALAARSAPDAPDAGAACARSVAFTTRLRSRVAADGVGASPDEPCGAVGGRRRNRTSAYAGFPCAARSGRASASSASRTPRSGNRRNVRTVPRLRSPARTVVRPLRARLRIVASRPRATHANVGTTFGDMAKRTTSPSSWTGAKRGRRTTFVQKGCATPDHRVCCRSS
jgi:hypothetical protein